jgi:putative nucleotidyltransferase with HDIG domain
MKLADDVILPDGRLLLLAGFILRPLYIQKLKMFNVKCVNVEDDFLTSTEECEEEKIYNHAVDTLKSFFSLASSNKKPNISEVEEATAEIISGVINNDIVMMQLTGIRDIDRYTYLHSVDVCIYSTILGKSLGYDKDMLLDLGIGAILHDIGKCKIPPEILLKPGKLTTDEFSLMMLHTVYGAEILKSTCGMNSRIANIAFQHHEKWNGSGYPTGVAAYDIDAFPRIVSLVDVYDALTSDRIYKEREQPHIAVDYLKRNSGILFDPYLVDLFVENIAVYFEGTLVQLSTGELGYVIETNSPDNKRQIVNVISNKFGPPVLHPYKVDLNQNQDITISKIFI